MALRVPARNVVGDQILESVTNASSREEQVYRDGGTFSQTPVTGSITTATTAITSGDVDHLNSCLISVSGTYAGVRFVFEVSPDGGTTWYPKLARRFGGGAPEGDTGVLAANALQVWALDLLGVNRVRVRATAWTSGSAAIRLHPNAGEHDPIVSAIISSPNGILRSYQFQGAAVTTEALASLTPHADGVAGTAATSHAIPTGKKFRPLFLSVNYRVGAAAVGGGAAYARFNPGGAVTATSPIFGMAGGSANAAVSGAAGNGVNPFTPGFDILGGWNVGVSHVGHATTANIAIVLIGIEF